jgi:hypothetical protein
MSALKLEFEVLAEAWKLIEKSKGLSWHRFLVLVIIFLMRSLIRLVRFDFYKKQQMRRFSKKLEQSVKKRWKEIVEILRAKGRK